MSRMDFYHLQKQSLFEVLPKLLLKAYTGKKRAVVKVGKAESLEKINTLLWTFQDDAFLPHGSKKDGSGKDQPIWLTSEDDNPNGAEFLFLCEGAEVLPEKIAEYERVFNIFDGNLTEAIEQARKMWKEYKTSGYEVFYWQQNNNGKWEQKA